MNPQGLGPRTSGPQPSRLTRVPPAPGPAALGLLGLDSASGISPVKATLACSRLRPTGSAGSLP